jgi:putative flippase GtrA
MPLNDLVPDSTTAQPLINSGIAFLIVGACAGLTHMGVFHLALPWMLPELANAAGFVIAFWVSFTGHRLLSFKDHATTFNTSFMRFGVTALLGFLANETVFIISHRWWGWAPWLCVLAGMGAASVQTFMLSRFWAFKR